MNDARVVGDLVWWVKRTVANAVLHSRSPVTIQDLYERAQIEMNASLRTVMGDLTMDDKQLRTLEGFIYRTVERRENIRAGKKDAAEDLAAQEKDDADLKAAFLSDWSGLI